MPVFLMVSVFSLLTIPLMGDPAPHTGKSNGGGTLFIPFFGTFSHPDRHQRLMRLMGIEAVYPKPQTTRRHPGHKVYPYLLRDMTIERPNRVWAADITYIPMNRGFMYLVAVLDWYSRKISSWRVSNTMNSDFCVEALQEAPDRYGRPDIFNTDQGSQSTSKDFTGTLKEHDVKISMDGRGRCQDNIFIKRLWWTIKYQYLYLHAFENGLTLRRGLAKWISLYIYDRGHSSLDDKTPDEVYYGLPHPSDGPTFGVDRPPRIAWMGADIERLRINRRAKCRHRNKTNYSGLRKLSVHG